MVECPDCEDSFEPEQTVFCDYCGGHICQNCLPDHDCDPNEEEDEEEDDEDDEDFDWDIEYLEDNPDPEDDE